MTIVFEGYSGPAGNGATTLPLGANGTDRTGSYGDTIMPLGAGGTGTEVGMGAGASQFPLAAFGADVANFGRATLPFAAVGFDPGVAPPDIGIGSTAMPFGPFGHGFNTEHGNGATMFALSTFGTDGNAFGRTTMPLSVYGRDVAPSRFATLYQFPWVQANGKAGVTYRAYDELGLVSNVEVLFIVQQLSDIFGLRDTANPMAELIKQLQTTIGLDAVVGAALSVLMQTTLGVSETLTAADVRALALSDTFALVAGLSDTIETDRLLALIFGMHDVVQGAQLVEAASRIGLHFALSDEVLVYAQAMTTLRLLCALTGDLLLTAVLADTIALGDTLTNTAEILAALASAIGIAATLQLADGAYTAWVMNAQTKAVWTYDNYPFNSFARLGDRYFGAGPDGISELVGADDAGTAISWNARTGVTNFGSQLEKRGVMAYLGYTSGGTVGLSVIVTEPDGAKVQYNYSMIPRNATDTTVNRIEIGKGLKSVYWQFEFAGTGPFSLSDARVLPMILSRRF